MYAVWKAELKEKETMAASAKYRRILLLSTDGGIHADFAFQYYCDNVQKDGDFLVMLYCPSMEGMKEVQENVMNAGKDAATRLGQVVLDESKRFQKDAKLLEQKLREKKLDGEVQIGVAGISADEAILETAKKENASMIILGARRLGKELQKKGSTKRSVVRKSTIPVLICRRGKYEAARKTREGAKRLVLGGSDGEMQSSEALKFYKEHIYKDGDFLLLAYIPKARAINPELQKKALTEKSDKDLKGELMELYADTAELLHDFIRKDLKMPGEVIVGEPNSVPGDALLDIAEREGADLIVIGSRGLSQHAYEAGSRTTDTVANDSKVTVLVKKY